MDDNYILRLSGKAELPQDIEIGHNWHISMEGSITSKTITDNENGSHSVTYLFKPIKVELLDDKGKMLKLKDTRTRTQLLRGRMYGIWSKLQTNLSFEDYWDSLMVKVIQHADEIAEMYDEK